jgi:hypothetical protein
MVNIGIKKLLPADWKAVAWIDADIKFESIHWSEDALKILNDGKDMVQLFTHCAFMDYDEQITTDYIGFGYQYCNNFKKGFGLNFWHPGFAWACNRTAYDKIGGVYELGILGDGDNIICHAFIKKAHESVGHGMSPSYIQSVNDYQAKFDGLRLGYVPGTIAHYFHGTKQNRKYIERNDILMQHQYNPFEHLTTDANGLLIPTDKCPVGLLDNILEYFGSRNEDEIPDKNAEILRKLQFIQSQLGENADHTLQEDVLNYLLKK